MAEAESTIETRPPPYTLPGAELLSAVQNTIASATTTTKPHYIFVETTMQNGGSIAYIHRYATDPRRYFTEPRYRTESSSSRANQNDRSAEQVHIAAIQDFTTYQELLSQIMLCVICPDGPGSEAKFGMGVVISEMEVVWKEQGKEDMIPAMKISGKGDEYAQRVLGMMEQRGWRDLIRIKFILTGK